MKRPRPYIPLPIRVIAAERQVQEMITEKIIPSIWWPLYQSGAGLATLRVRLAALLGAMTTHTGVEKWQLDHDPALVLRKFKVDRRKPVAAWYQPNANDPFFLLYRPEADHQQKTTGRRPGALRTVTTKGSDIGLKTKFARLERKGKKRKAKIPSRPFSKQKRRFQ